MQSGLDHLQKITFTLSAWRHASARNIPFDTAKYINQLELSNPCRGLVEYPRATLPNPRDASMMTSRVSRILSQLTENTTGGTNEQSVLGNSERCQNGSNA